MLLDIFDPKAPPQAIGIDLGTTHSVVAAVRDGRPRALLTCDGSALLPSVVHYGDHGRVLVGRTARAYATREPTRTISSAKRLVGRGADDGETQTLSAYRFLPATTEEERRVVRFDVGGRGVTPVEVSAEILRSLKQSAVDQLKSVGGAVITVPAYFDDAQRQATRDAGRLAGLDVLRLLNEPTAAALAYGLDKQVEGTFVVFDLGGGTFDVTVLRLEDGIFQVRSTGGDSALGGDDMDRALAEELLVAMGAVEPAQRGPELVSLALSLARDAKHALTEQPVVDVLVPTSDGERAVPVERAHFDALIAPLLERAGRASKRALRDAGLSASELDGVILVGGSTRVPRVRSYVAELFGCEPLADLDPDLVVAYGAAIQAELLSSERDDVLLLDVLPLSLGIETMGGAVDRILPRNTTIPCGAKATFTTYADRQTGFDLHVVQGERELAADCRSLARFLLRGIPPLPAGLARLEVHFHVDENGLLSVTARELTTGLEQRVEVRPSHGLTDEQIEDMLVEAIDHGEDDFEQRKLVEARVEGSRMLLATQKGLASDADLLSEAQRARVDAAISALADAIERATRPAVVQSAVDELDRVTKDWAGARMNRAIATAIAGRQLGAVADSVAHAAGVDSHVAAHAAAARGEVVGTAPVGAPTGAAPISAVEEG